MNINEKTLKILEFVTKYGFIDTYICSNIFYKNKQYGYNQAARKLKQIYDCNLIKRYINHYNRKYVYVIDTTKQISFHMYVNLMLYSKIYSISNTIEYFNLEEKWCDGLYRSDSHIIYSKDDYTRSYLVEVDIYHKTSQDKLDGLYNSNDVQKWYLDKYGVEIYPRILIINASGNTNIVSNDYKVFCYNYNLLGLDSII